MSNYSLLLPFRCPHRIHKRVYPLIHKDKTDKMLFLLKDLCDKLVAQKKEYLT